MTTKDLINAIVTGDAIEIENSFNLAMADKISTALEDKRIEVSQSLFASKQEEQASEE